MKKSILSLAVVLAMIMPFAFALPSSAETGTKYGDYLYYEVNSDGTAVTITDCDSSATGAIEIPSIINNLPITAIGNSAFYGCGSITNITIPDSTMSISDEAFCDCNSLTSVTIPNSVTSIGHGAFASCSNLTSVTIPDSVTSIGRHAFYDTAYDNNESNWENGILYIGHHLIEASSIDGEYKIREGTITIAGHAFSDINGLTNITIPDSVKSIGDNAFYRCSELTNVTIGDNITTIGKQAFQGCTSLTSIVIPNSVKTIDDSAFIYCTELTSVIIGNNVKTIGWSAFQGCTSLTRITIPDSVASISGGAFNSCTSLTDITIPDSVKSIGGGVFYDTAYYNNENNWENGILYIGHHLIEASLIDGEYNVQEGTITIAGSAFSDINSLTKVTIPNSVISIGKRAFEDCNQLEDVYYHGTESEWNNINIDSYNEPLASATMHYNSTPYVNITAPIVTKTDKDTAWVFNINVDTVHPNSYIYAACYDANGVLLGINKVELTAETTEVSLAKQLGAATVKVFAMTDDIRPITTVWEDTV